MQRAVHLIILNYMFSESIEYNSILSSAMVVGSKPSPNRFSGALSEKILFLSGQLQYPCTKNRMGGALGLAAGLAPMLQQVQRVLTPSPLGLPSVFFPLYSTTYYLILSILFFLATFTI